MPRVVYSDNGSAMISGEFSAGLHHLGILPLTTRPRSAWMNGKQETLWSRVENRLMAMLDAVRSKADIVDSRTGVIQATVYPLDKTRHADGRRRRVPVST